MLENSDKVLTTDTMNMTAAATAPGAARRGANRLLAFMQRRLRDCAAGFELALPDGSRHRFGAGAPRFTLKITHPHGLKALASFDEGIIANAYIDGWFDVQGDLIEIYDLRLHLQDRHLFQWLWRFIAPALLGQVAVNRSAISRHYERDHSFYLAFLDEDHRCYTQGVFESPDEPIGAAVRRKLDFIMERCRLGAGSEVLEVGPGWGSFAEYAARQGVKVTGVTIAEQSLRFMRQLAEERSLPITTIRSDILEFQSEKQFDAVVLLGIMEHLPNYADVLRCFDRLLKPGGFVFLDASAITRKYKLSSFITEHIYPGNHSFFVLHDFLRHLAVMPFDLKGVWDDRDSYHLTFSHWARRFDSNREFIIDKFGAADYRRFRLYLWGAAHCFLRNRLQCYRLVMQKHPQAA